MEIIVKITLPLTAQDVKNILQQHLPTADFDVIEVLDYYNLIDDSMKLNALERGGVSNWEWYDDAMESLNEG